MLKTSHKKGEIPLRRAVKMDISISCCPSKPILNTVIYKQPLIQTVRREKQELQTAVSGTIVREEATVDGTTVRSNTSYKQQRQQSVGQHQSEAQATVRCDG